MNFSGGGGGGATTTSGIQSENLAGQTLENELDALTSQQTANTTAIATNTANIGNNANAIGTNTTNIGTNTTAISGLLLQQQTNTTNIASNTASIGTNTTNIGTNTTAISGLLLQQQNNTNNIASNTAAVTGLQTTQGTQASSISTLQATSTAHGTDISDLQTNDTTQDTNITNLQTTQATQGTSITNLQTTQTTQGTDITALQNQQILNNSAIASNTARTSNLTADRILISSATGTINTAGIGVTDVATKNSGNSFNAPLGNPATQNSFDTITASTITNTGTTESNAYTQAGAPLNFSHLAGSTTTAQLPTQVVRTDVPDQTLQGNAATSSLTKVTIDNTHATGTSQLALQKRTTAGVLEGGLTIQQTTTGTNITGQAPAGQNPDISITPANGSLAMTIGGLESRFHNNLKIIGSMSGAARSDNKDYIFKTIGSTGTGDVLLLEDVLQRPTTGVPAAGFNPTNNSLVEFNSTGVPTYKETSNFLSKPGLTNPTLPSFIEVNTGGSFSYKPSSFIPLPGGALPSSNENVVFVNPGGTSYVDRANLIERVGNSNPSTGTALITINSVGTRAYKDLGQFLTTPSGANPSSDSFIKISSTGVQSYVAESSLGGGIQKPGNSNPTSSSLIKLDSAGNETYLEESSLFKTNVAAQTITQGITSTAVDINSSNGGVGIETHFKVSTTGTPAGTSDNDFEIIPKRGTNTQLRSKNDMDWYIGGNRKFGLGNHNATMFQPLQMDNDFRLKHGQSVPTSSSSNGVVGTLMFDDNYLYIARSTNSWKRVALSNF